ncbi:MAG: hypothetical protein ACRESF_11545 [Pseudomonas sp.]
MDKLFAADRSWLDVLPKDEEVSAQILAQPWHFAFTPRIAKQAKVRFGNAVVTAKKWTVTPQISGKADVTNFEGASIAGPTGGDTLMIEQTLGCTVKLTFNIELDADAAANLYDAGIKPGNSTTALKCYLHDTTGPFWSFPTPFFERVPMTADVKSVLGHTIDGEGSASFLYPTGAF